MKRAFRALLNYLMTQYVKRYGVDEEDRDAILMHMDWNVASKLGLNLNPDVAGDYLRYLEGRKTK